MGEQSVIDHFPGQAGVMNLVAEDWWSGADARLLPAMAGGVTGFVIDFPDGRRFSRYPELRMSDRVSALVTKGGARTTNGYMTDHAVRVPSEDAAVGLAGDIGPVVDLPAGTPVFAGVQCRAGGAGLHIDTEAVSTVVTGFAPGRFELENWSRRWGSNPPLGDDKAHDSVAITFLFCQNHTESAYFSK